MYFVCASRKNKGVTDTIKKYSCILQSPSVGYKGKLLFRHLWGSDEEAGFFLDRQENQTCWRLCCTVITGQWRKGKEDTCSGSTCRLLLELKWNMHVKVRSFTCSCCSCIYLWQCEPVFQFKRYSDNDCTEHFCAITVLNSSTHLKAEEFISLGNTCSVNLVHQEKKKFVFWTVGLKKQGSGKCVCFLTT